MEKHNLTTSYSAEALVDSLKRISLETGETVEKLYKEFVSILIDTLRYQLYYDKLDADEQFDKRPERNSRLVKVGLYIDRINGKTPIFQYNFHPLRPFQRGQQVEEMIKDIIYIYQAVTSIDVKEQISKQAG